MTFYYFCYAPPVQTEAQSPAAIREPTRTPAAKGRMLPAAIPDRLHLLHDVKAIG